MYPTYPSSKADPFIMSVNGSLTILPFVSWFSFFASLLPPYSSTLAYTLLNLARRICIVQKINESTAACSYSEHKATDF